VHRADVVPVDPDAEDTARHGSLRADDLLNLSGRQPPVLFADRL
jgi:hypothetical protein